MKVVGTCKLCLKSSVELRDSHLLPKAGYRLLRKSQGNESPVVMKPDVSIVKDEQVRGNVFCGDCEALLSKNGENWILRNCHRPNEGFALKSALDVLQPEHDDGANLTVYSATRAPDIDFGKIVYFASSVFWRASVHQWKSAGHELKAPRLGRIYEEQFRSYLMGHRPFPNNATLWLSIITEEGFWNFFTFPYGDREDGYWRSHFQFMGLSFDLFLGNLVPRDLRRFCLSTSPEHFIAMSKAADNMVMTHSGRLIGKSKPIGSLTKPGQSKKV
jgi:hypothetical protein